MATNSLSSRRVPVLTLCVMFVFALTAGCSAHHKPSDEEVRNEFVAAKDNDAYVIENFTRVNGYKGEGDAYLVEVKYDVVFKKSFQDVVRTLRSLPADTTQMDALQSRLTIKYLGNL